MDDRDNFSEREGNIDLQVSNTEDNDSLNSSLESQREIATEVGRFYNAFIDNYLEFKTPKEIESQAIDLVEELPLEIRRKYLKGITSFQEELVKNHFLLEQHRGDECRYLLSTVMTEQGKSKQEIEEILSKIDKAKFIEPSPGLAIIQSEKDFFQLLKENGIVNAQGRAVEFGSDTSEEPSFLLIQRFSLEKSLMEESDQVKNNSSVRHEFHHFIWNFLKRRGDLFAEVVESTPQRTKAFENFRNELAAYILEGHGINHVDAEVMVYTEDQEILKEASDVRDLATICIDVSKQKGVDLQNYLYACLSSRNFEELKNMFVTLTPLDKINIDSIDNLYTAGLRNYRASSKVVELLKRKNLSIQADLFSEYALYRMGLGDKKLMREVLFEWKNLKEFTSNLKIDNLDEQGLLENAAKLRLPLPKSTIDTILGLPVIQLNTIPLDKSGENFLKEVVRFSNIKEESTRVAYKQILNSSPKMRESFNNVRDEIIKENAQIYRNEFKSSSEERKQQVELDIQRMSQLIMEL